MTPVLQFVDLTAQQERIRAAIDRAVSRVLDHGQFILGPEVDELEHELARRADVEHVVTCSSGTEAIVMSLRALGIGPGDAVAVPSFTFVASGGAVALAGATPVFADVDPATFLLESGSARRVLGAAREAGLRPAGVLAVDLFGLPADAGALALVAEEFGADLLVDAAQSFGARIGSRPVGGFGRVTTTSFFPAKPLGCYGDGGAIFTDDAALAADLRSIRVHGQGVDKYDNIRLGTNGRLDTLQAAILLEKLRIFDDELTSRQQLADWYSNELDGHVRVPREPEGFESSWCCYTIRVDGRDQVVEQLAAAGVPTMTYYRRGLHQQPVFRGALVDPNGLPTSDALVTDVLSLPIHPYVGEERKHVVERIADIASARRG